jgi:bifunctional non-homologous end joining protein LigD
VPPPVDRQHVTVDGRRLEISNLAKVLYPATGFTKGAVIDYYVRVAGPLLAELRDRALTLVRWPNGVEGGHFYEKRCPPHAPDWVRTVDVPSGRHGVVRHVVCDDRPTLVWLANLAALELHPLLSRAPRLDEPTSVVFDLDPGPPADVLDAGRVALLVRDVIERAGLPAPRLKTSGGKGLHAVVPVVDRTYEETRPFAQALAQALERQHPERVVAVQDKQRRTGRVLVDWNQNGFTNTTVAVYSLRATPVPRVSTPITWDELDDALAAGERHRLEFGPADVISRVASRGDLFADPPVP